MNKLIKSAMMMASVGAMLCIVGCGEKTPAEKAVKVYQELNALMAKADSKGLPMEAIEELKSGKMKKEDLAEAVSMAEKIQIAMPGLKQYIAMVIEGNSLLKAKGGNPIVSSEELPSIVFEFIEKSPEEQRKFIEGVESDLKGLKSAN